MSGSGSSSGLERLQDGAFWRATLVIAADVLAVLVLVWVLFL